MSTLPIANNKINIPTPPSEDSITSSWRAHDSCRVSICMLVYNHEKYISESISSILNQKTNFPFELLIHDDASTDNSQKIIKDYELRYPNIIKAIYQTENQHSQGINPSVHYNYPRTQGEYISICEGDDYWCDPYKLQEQVNCLDGHKEINLCFHQASQISYFNASHPEKTIGTYAEQNKIIPFEKTLYLTNGMVPTASCMIRSEVKERLRLFMKERPHLTLGDRFLQFFGSYPNGSFYINKIMSVYRLGTENSWSASIAKNPEHKIRHEKVMLLAFTELNKEVNYSLSDKLAVIYLQRLLWFFRPQINLDSPLQPTILDKPTINSNTLKDPGIESLEPKFFTVQKEIKQTLKDWSQKSGAHIIFGAGSGCKLILETIGSLNISAIIDRDNKRVGETINTVPTISLDNVVDYDNPNILVSVPSSNKVELNKELKKLGIPDKNIHYLFDSAIKWLADNPFTKEELDEVYKSINIADRTY